MIPFLIDQYFEETALLYTRRTWFVEQPHVGLANLLELDRRIDAQLDGLVEAGHTAWERCCEELHSLQPGECFAAAFLALQSGEPSRMAKVLEGAEGTADLVQPIAMALGWRSWDEVAGLAKEWLKAGSWRTAIGMAAHRIHGVDPGDCLAQAVDDPSAPARQFALRGAGELGRIDLLDRVVDHLADADLESARWAAWSVGLLRGNEQDIQRLVSIVTSDQEQHRAPVERAFLPVECKSTGRNARPTNSYLEQAAWCLPLIVGRQDQRLAQSWQQELARSGHDWLSIAVAAQNGCSAVVPWLLEKMIDPSTARMAAEAFTIITGLRVHGESFEVPSPLGFDSGPTDDPEDDDVAMDSDEYLPWPNAAAVAGWWTKQGDAFSHDERYLLGRPRTEDWYWEVVRAGMQRERFQAALNLALQPIGRKLFDVRSPSVLQFSRLSAIASD